MPPGARSYWPSTLLAMNARSAPASAPVTLPPTACAVAPGGLAAPLVDMASNVGSSIALIESALTAIHVARSTTRAPGAPPGVSIRAVSATGWRAVAAAVRIAATSASASARVTVGPAGTRVLPVVFANSQSTYPT